MDIIEKPPASRTVFWILRSLCCVLCLSLMTTGNVVGQDTISFNRQIRPILTSICFNCHGPDAEANEGGVRLDSLEYAETEGHSGEPAIVPGSSEESELIRRILDEDDPMPPADFPKQLTAEQKELLERWVDEGAKSNDFCGTEAFAGSVPPHVDPQAGT